MNKTHVLKRTIERLPDGMYKVVKYDEDYYTEKGLKNLVDVYTENTGHIKLEMATHENPALKEKVVLKVLEPYVGLNLAYKVKYKEVKAGNFVFDKDVDENGNEVPGEEEVKFNEYYNNLTQEEKDSLELPFTEEEVKKINESKLHINYILEQAYAQNKVACQDNEECIEWWQKALDTGSSKIEKTHILNF